MTKEKAKRYYRLDKAWGKFICPALRREAYEKDGFKAIRVDIFICEVK